MLLICLSLPAQTAASVRFERDFAPHEGLTAPKDDAWEKTPIRIPSPWNVNSFSVLRLYECHNQRARATVNIGIPFERVYECDLMEDDIAEPPCRNGEIALQMKPFEIRTLEMLPRE